MTSCLSKVSKGLKQVDNFNSSPLFVIKKSCEILSYDNGIFEIIDNEIVGLNYEVGFLRTRTALKVRRHGDIFEKRDEF